jgi:glycolate oxidase FAD binding subunit
MAEHFKPETPEQVKDAVAWAIAEEIPLEIIGGGSKRGLGRLSNAETVLELSALKGISLYESEELVLSAGPGTLLSEIEATLAESRQQLAFEPPDYGPLLGGSAGTGTLGGMIACNLSGPRRIKAGAARDHFLGFNAVSGRGEAFKSGGRVVKNVTGYDLSKLLCGSWGTLGAMTDLTVKVLPVAEKTRTVLVLVEYRVAALRKQLAAFGETEELHSHNSDGFWRELRDVLPFAAAGDQRCVWKISVAPTAGPMLAAQLTEALGGDAFLDWGGGLVWLAIDAPQDGGADTVRAAVDATGGHATLIRAPEPVRAAVSVFHPSSAGVAALSKRVKENFDPRGLLNPGRMYAEL